ncbi:hypothetical protein Droror1_Dr00002253 [Drosera rotundifolia]
MVYSSSCDFPSFLRLTLPSTSIPSPLCLCHCRLLFSPPRAAHHHRIPLLLQVVSGGDVERNQDGGCSGKSSEGSGRAGMARARRQLRLGFGRGDALRRASDSLGWGSPWFQVL